MIKRIAAAIVGIGVAGGVGFLAYAWYPEIAPVAPPPPSAFSKAQIEHGRILAAGGYCAECHTRTDGKRGVELAGDYKMDTPFGAIFSSNITPDPETGIGHWSEAAFKRAMRKGISRDGTQLFPAFPFDHFTHMTDQDIDDVYAFLMTREPVHSVKRDNTVAFPFNIRLEQAGWKLLFLHEGPLKNNSAKDAEWNRGAYLAEGLSHCSACHTPRNAMGAEKSSAPYDGAPVDNWIAPPLNEHNPTPVVWTEDEYFKYLRYGSAPLHGSAAGPMSPVVHGGLSEMPESDVHAIAHYLADIDKASTRVSQDPQAIAWAMKASMRDLVGPQTDPNARLYAGACAACHANAGPQPVEGRPDLALNNALWLDEPTNLFQVILRGIGTTEGISTVSMPSFYHSFSDADLARLAAYLRATRTTLKPWTDLEKKAADVRKTLVASPVASSH
ncbi:MULTISPECIES: cytochrome c [Novacetimonas]|uniref:Aldehyde dehydrogenase n=1 Tax=Novacetimonas cocois TaxID=1747507 RepID=A0A365YRH7_9PROT|nr:cytochrome c [Novacetimonas cocois]MBV1833809.1 c-type cytochrome [Novacetimonas pomaceti]RBM05303.1 aldehyde dehydrogenase [Novacetimonas cocois]